MAILNSLGYFSSLISKYEVQLSSTIKQCKSASTVDAAVKLLPYSSVVLKHSDSEQGRRWQQRDDVQFTAPA